MVMHARKLPRIDDGYSDKREAQSYQSSSYPSKASYSNHSERYDRRRSPGRDSPTSRDSPRYLNKSSYIERNKEKYDRGNTSSPGKKANNNYAGGSHHGNSGNHSGGQDRARGNTSGSKHKSETPVQKSAIRTCGDWSEHISSTGKPYYYNCKTEVSQWEKPRDWTDTSSRHDRHSSDSRTSNDKHGSKDGRNRHSSGANEKREKHLGGLRHMVQDGNPKPDKMYLFEKLQQSQSKLQAEMQANLSNKPLYSSDHKDILRRNDECNTNDYPNSSSRRSRRDSDGARIGRQMSRQDTDELDSPGSTPTSHISGGTPQLGSGLNPLGPISTTNLSISSIPGLITQLSGGQNNQELTNKALQTLQKLQQALSRQIAAHQTSVVATQSSSTSTVVQASPHRLSTPHQDEPLLHHPLHHPQPHPHPQATPTSLAPPPHSSTHLPPQHRSPYLDSHQSHPPLHPPQSSPQGTVTIAATSCVATTTGSTSIPITHTGNHFPKGNTVYGKFLGSSQNSTPTYPKVISQDDGGGGETKGIDGGGGSERSSCCSPAPSDTSSQGAPVDLDMFSAANPQHENNLMLSLKQYYNEALVSHVTGWHGELVEKQARMFGDEALKIGSLIGSQVSVELKRARSLVRVEEIQATLQEQRNLFLAQQIAELENMKPVSSITSFLPSTPTSSS